MAFGKLRSAKGRGVDSCRPQALGRLVVAEERLHPPIAPLRHMVRPAPGTTTRATRPIRPNLSRRQYPVNRNEVCVLR